MIEVVLAPFMVEGFNVAEAVRISLAIFTSVVLVFVDTLLRVLVEARNFNLATNRELTIKNMFLAIYGEDGRALKSTDTNEDF